MLSVTIGIVTPKRTDQTTLMKHLLTRQAILLLLLTLAPGSLPLCADDAAGVAYFESKIRPLLVEHCYECHSAEAKNADSLEANLYLDSRAGWEVGGDSGRAVVPGKPDESLLIKAVSYSDGALEMPPANRLSDREIEALRKWVAMGAPDPRAGEVTRSQARIDLEKGREFWSFQPPVNHPIPEVNDTKWPASNIDRYVSCKARSRGNRPG